ncbi:ATP-binding protein [Rhizobium sp. FY34]|uniref:sensor histidine kinase n=1 Tax=Rhizobium sp. FY34 TaxID=2562309 RepID=UPI0010C11896|nr:ATP-binding protein [Rhizobium sp. FY34]
MSDAIVPSPLLFWRRFGVQGRVWLVFGLSACLLLATALLATRHFATVTALAGLERQGRVDAGLKVALLRAVLERPRSLPLLLSRDRDVEDALQVPVAGRIEDLNRKLEDLVLGTNAAVLYVIDTRGITIASSNWREPSSFVGSDYAFREYFSQAMRDGRAEHFALGSVSGRPGLYISHRVESAGKPIGVVVVKAEFDQLESDWRDALRPTFVTDENGLVLVTSIASWRFMSLGIASSDVLQAVRASLQFGHAALAALPIRQIQTFAEGGQLIETVLPGKSLARYVAVAVPVPSTPWTLNYLLPVEPALASSIRQAQLSMLLVLAPLLAFGAFLIRRRQTILAKIATEQAARQELERRVVERTQALTQARDRLQAEITDHRVTEERLQGVQQELVQANRLAILGQVAAGVAHEINQPVATIRAYADNARIFLERAQSGPAGENLQEIARLTDRIGTITEDLKALSRKGRSAPEPVCLADVMSGAVLLLKSRFAGRLDLLTLDLPDRQLLVLGNRLRLEQVVINLLQNALEAIEPQPQGRVHAFAIADAGNVTLVIEDNGPGIPATVLDQLFTPFNSSKEAGLGLGLVIAKDIVSDYGGRITVESSMSGTRFGVVLTKASP